MSANVQLGQFLRAHLTDHAAVEALWKATLDVVRPLEVAVLNAAGTAPRP